ncbi:MULTISPECIES: hypothetical protein [Actinokineospora]|uniref:Uncharacterized protein n=1 Tax=Actinokineospora fastidiosa TaxID=1816 RepID=A0A918G3I2_9PSEU|nr:MULTISPECIES: hypothetical protein [Actinokineospora]UVS76511.1 hypothetical protein Actkin_00201 [Actinokineospora sp. UTMC 2448]GGS17622.1 hypothetical protein GCM10010171_07620 [Actinokineospora fastidiosa]
MTTFWIVAAALVVLYAAWRLRRANHTLQTILREERDRVEPAQGDEPVSHRDRERW